MEISPVDATIRPPLRDPDQRLRDVALKLEASFLAEMLRSAKLGQTPEEFGGGIGEEQFSSLLVETYAEKLAERDGLGLAEHIFNSIKQRESS